MENARKRAYKRVLAWERNEGIFADGIDTDGLKELENNLEYLKVILILRKLERPVAGLEGDHQGQQHPMPPADPGNSPD